MILDLSQYKDTVGTYTEAEAAKAIEDKHRPLEAGIHECVLVDFNKLKAPGTPEGEAAEEAICVIAKDPAWIMFSPIFENAEGQRKSITILMPLTGELRYRSASGADTTFPYKNFIEFVAALGFDPLEEERVEITVMRAITRTNAECLMSLIGAQVKLKVEWGDAGSLHPQYNADEKVYYLVNSVGEIPNGDLCEPFVINKALQGKDRWAEMALRARDAGYFFQYQPNVKVMRHDTVKNDLSVFLPKKAKPVAAVITKAAPKPAVAVLKNPPIATKPPVAAPAKVIPDEALLSDESMPIEE